MSPRILLFALASVSLAAAACSTTTVFHEDDGDGGVCESFLNEEGEGAVTVRFKNDSGVDVYLDGACDRVLYSLDAVAPTEGSLIYDLSCAQTCEEAQQSDVFSCAGACQSVAYRIPAGGTHEVRWNGKRALQADMPEACWFGAGAGQSCTQIVGAEAGTYAVSVTGYSACGDELGGSSCACDESGACFGGFVSGQAVESQRVEFAYPTPNVIDVTFGVCAFGCAGSE